MREELFALRVFKLLHAEAVKIPLVEIVYLRPDGREFVVVTGAESVVAEATVGRLAAAVTDAGAGFIEGSWRRDRRPPFPDWGTVYYGRPVLFGTWRKRCNACGDHFYSQNLDGCGCCYGNTTLAP